MLRGCHTCMRCLNVKHSKKCTCAGQLFSLGIYNRNIKISQRIGKDFICVIASLFFFDNIINIIKVISLRKYI